MQSARGGLTMRAARTSTSSIHRRTSAGRAPTPNRAAAAEPGAAAAAAAPPPPPPPPPRLGMAPAAALPRPLRRRTSAGRASTHIRAAAAETSGAASGRLVNARRRSSGALINFSAEIETDTQRGISLHDLTPLAKQAVAESGVSDGIFVIQSRHTTVSVIVNEYESRLMDDLRQYLARLVPASDPWLHNDLHLRYAPPGWPGGDEAWRSQEPINAHSHVQAMLLGGGTASLSVVDGKLTVGQWQSVIGIELDGARQGRRWGVTVQGLAAE